MTTNPHVCDGRMLIERAQGGKIIKFECPMCTQHFYPIAEMDVGTGAVHWFAGLPSARMAQVAKSSNVVQNVLAIEADKTPIYDRILYVRTDGP